MPYSNYSRVKLISDSHQNEGAPKYSLGYIVEVYPGGKYEVEFSDPRTGNTLAQIVVSQQELELAPEV